MAKPRIIIPISLQFSVRYLLRTGLLAKLQEFCEPVILLAWSDPGLERELATVGEVHSIRKSQWGARYEKARGVINEWHRRRFASPSTPIRERRANLDRKLSDRVRKSAHRMIRTATATWPGMLNAVRRDELRLLWADTNARDVQREIGKLHADGVFCLAPFIPDEEMTTRVCSMEGMPCCAAILSFDNLTTRSWIPVIFDEYLLWNRHNVGELRRGYPEAAASQVTIVGSPQFDFYWDSSYIMSETEWRRSLGLPSGRPVILFGGGYYTCAPHEAQFLAQLDEAVQRHEIPGDPAILFRRHPVDPIGRWEPVLCKAKNVVHDDPWEFRSATMGHTNVLPSDIAKLASTLYYSFAHVNVASTMSVDGAIFDRPQIGPAYDDSRGAKYHRSALECYQQEHFLPIYESGGIAIVRSRRELMEALRSAVLNPGERKAGREKIVTEICTYNDGKCTARVADAVRSFIGKSVPALQATSI